MASAYSKPADYGTYTPPVNLELVNFVLSSKQQKYDYNLAKLDDKVSNQLGSLDLVRAEDKEYFLNRASNMINSMGDISKMDLSKNGVTRQIDSKLSAIVDERVLNDVQSTRNYRAFQNTLQHLQTEDPDSYSEINAAYAMETQGVNSWLQGQSGTLGNVRYQNYVDVSEELRDISENLDKYAHVVKKFDMQGSYFINQEGERLEAHEVTSIAEQLLSDKAKAQMDINGWANYDRGVADASVVGDEFRRYTDQKLANVKSTLSELELRVKNEEGVSSNKLEKYRKDLEDYRRYESNLTDSYSKMLADPNKYRHSMTSTMEKDRVLTRFGETFAIDNVGDPVYTANTVVTAENKLAWEREKFMMELQAEADATAGSISTIDFQQELPDVDLVGDYTKSVATKEKAAFGAVNQAFNTLSVEDKAAIDASYNKESGETIEEHRYKAMKDLSKANSRIISASAMLDIDRAMHAWGSEAEALTTARDEAYKFVEEQAVSHMVDQYKDNSGIDIVDENGNVVSGKEYLKSIESEEDFNKPENHGKKEQMLKAFYMDKLLTTIPDRSVGNFFRGVWNRMWHSSETSMEKMPDVSREQAVYVSRLRELFNGDEAELMKYYDLAKQGGAYDTNNVLDGTLDVFGPGGPLLNRPNSVTDVPVMNDLITDKKLDAKTAEILREDFSAERKLGQVVSTDTPAGEELARIAGAKFANVFGEGVVLKTGPSRGITIVENSPDTVSVSGLVTIKGEDVRKEITLLKSNLPASLTRNIDFNTQRPMYTKNSMREVESNSVAFYEESNVKRVKDIESVLMKANPRMNPMEAQQMAWLTTTDEIMGRLSKSYPNVMGIQNQPTQQRLAIERMLNEKKFNVGLEKIGDDFHVNISFNDIQGNKVGLKSDEVIREADYESATILATYAPQIFIYKFLEQQLILNSANTNEVPGGLTKIINHYGVQ